MMVRKRGGCLPRELRIKLYKEVQALRRQGLGYWRIRKKVKELYGVALNSAVINHWCKGIHTPYNAIRIPTIDFLEPSPELAYVIGVVAGDGYAVKSMQRSGDYRIEAIVKDREFAEEFPRCLGKVLDREPPKPIPEKKWIVSSVCRIEGIVSAFTKTHRHRESKTVRRTLRRMQAKFSERSLR
ncbi:MAG: hypothetical protein QXM16_03470 [Nitrososphaerota archaeon]